MGEEWTLYKNNNLRTAELEETLWIIEPSPCQQRSVGNWPLNLQLHSQVSKLLSYAAVLDTFFFSHHIMMLNTQISDIFGKHSFLIDNIFDKYYN